MDKKQKRGIILPHTHWDREWRYPMWKNRMLLIDFMDELLDILDTDPDYHCFLMDGQSVPIEDYLEVKPEMEERVKKHILDGRILIGPWYTLPDLYPIDGECLVRNLLKGMRVSKSYGKVMKIGYNSFGWGQTAQLPQIYAGFGIDFIICAKKVSEERAPESEFFWEAPDGTKILTSRLGQHARANFYFNLYLKVRYGVDCLSKDFKYSPKLSGMAIHNADEAHWQEDYFVIEPTRQYQNKFLKDGIAQALKATDDTLFKDIRLFLNGTDFSTPHRELSAMIQSLNQLSEDTVYENANLEVYANALKEEMQNKKLRVIQGELRDGPASDCSGNALSSRIYLKQLNKKAQNLLIHQAEPLLAIYGINGMNEQKSYQAFLDKAWSYLLKSHPHDSINGVTQDKTANDVEYRLQQVLEMGQVLVDQAIFALVKNVDLSGCSEDEQILFLWNPHPFSVSEVVKVNIDSPQEQEVWSFTAKDGKGNALRLQEIAKNEKVYPVHDQEARPWPYAADRHEYYLETGEIEAFGYKVVRFTKALHLERTHFYWMPMKKSEGEDIYKGGTTLENEFLKATIQNNGTIVLVEKEHGRIYERLHYFEDTGDVGNYWAYYPPYHNKTYTTLTKNVTTWCEDNGPLSATMAIRYEMELPVKGYESKCGIRGEGKRSEETTTYPIVSRITLKKGSRRLDIKTTVDNTIENHRLRVAFPTGIQTDWVHAQGHYTVDKRPSLPVKDASGLYDPQMQTLPMQNFVDMNDSKRGLSLINDGLTEYECGMDEDRTLYLTLFRAMGNMIVTWWEAVGEFPDQNGSQLLRKMEFQYSIYPHEGGWEHGCTYQQAQRHNIPLLTYQVRGKGKHGGERPESEELLEDQVRGKNQKALPMEHGYLKIENPNLILSAFKKAEDRESYILRLYNPTLEEIASKVSIKLGDVWYANMYQCNLNEEREEELKNISEENETFIVRAASNKILTFEMEVKKF
ncbi:glycosyl hydrolase-related protein [Lachnospiraceae bacterium ZAX-1]